MLCRGERIEALIGDTWLSGHVNYARMAGPDYTEVAAYSVVLDKHLSRPGYSGTVVSADKVRRSEVTSK
jgi:hypothetical protein